MIALLTALLVAASPVPPPGAVYHGRQNQLEVRLPRLTAEIAVDGRLDEAVWAGAALLTGFSQYEPVDGLPAADSTEVLIWYSPHALHVGVRAFEAHAPVNATLADRDRIFSDDHIQLLLDPFNDRRRALLFAVNPLGVQADGYETEEQRAAQMFGAAEATARIDLSPDFQFESRGRVTESGYEVEVRIPFRSLRYPSSEPQTWGIHVLRRVQHARFVQSWTPARRGANSFLAQGGSLVGLSGMRRGLVADVNPILTSRIEGGAGAGGGWRYRRQDPEAGVNARWGITTALTLSGTVNPDFSQVEADVSQIQFDPRQALSFPEKRPFFLEAAEQFAAPNALIYTRRIASPDAALKLAGQLGGMDVGYLAAVDAAALSRSGEEHPVYNILRLRRPLGAQNTLGLTYTDRIEGGDYNRMGALDARLALGERYVVNVLLAGSRTRRAGETVTAPFWNLAVRRAGREFGWTFTANGRDPDFLAGSGFVSRPGMAQVNFTPRMTRYGRAGGLLESWNASIALDGLWYYDRLLDGERRPDERKVHINNSLQLRGGWTAGASLLLENFLLPPELYGDYAIDLGADTVPFVGRLSINNYDVLLTLGTPQWQRFAGDAFILFGRDENYSEWAPGYIVWATLEGAWRPNERLRLEGSYNETRVMRPDDGSVATLTQIPRVKAEYQLSRPIFLRLVGEYVAAKQDALHDDGRTERPILLRNQATGRYEASRLEQHNAFRWDWLFSFQPSPGTVLFAGYGSSRAEPAAPRLFGWRGREREQDGFFIKLSYLLPL
ncbi:MAG: carbohydrate binding family 9 domain-containing protein [Gemmatimonadetes bacterium]|nr:carbohydrate binding family 9 domain-containing protein [Gemmatimonadota bacterium]